jgi:hypothetical protein
MGVMERQKEQEMSSDPFFYLAIIMASVMIGYTIINWWNR